MKIPLRIPQKLFYKSLAVIFGLNLMTDKEIDKEVEKGGRKGPF